MTEEDVQGVLGNVRAAAQSTHGGFSRQAVADPDILSTAIFLWWLVTTSLLLFAVVNMPTCLPELDD